MAPAGPQPLILALITAALLPGPCGAQGSTSVLPQEAILPRGGSIELNCSAPCAKPGNLGLETPLPKVELASGDNWTVFKLSEILKTSSPICFAACDGAQVSSQATITVYWFPETVELAPLPLWHPVGQNLTLSCLVTGGEPRAQLTLVLLRGEEELSRQPVLGDPAVVTATVLASRSDHGANFSCATELDLRPHGLGLFQNTSAPRRLQTFILPMNSPQLSMPRVVETGTLQPVGCFLDGLFPASEAQIHLELGSQRLSFTTTYSRDSVSAMATIEATADLEGPQNLLCMVSLGTQRRQTQQTLTIYSFPGPNLTLSEPEVSEGNLVMVSCEALAGAWVTLSSAPAKPPSSKAQLQVNASAEDHGRRFSCSAGLEVSGQVLYKNRTVELRVLYGPRLDERDCLGNWTWEEGSHQTLICQARGNPAPQLSCNRIHDGAPLPTGDVRPVKREQAGTYLCRAVSSRGEVIREVVLRVSYNQNNLVVIILVTVGLILGTVAIGAYLYNRQRKIKKYKLQKAREACAMKLNVQAPPLCTPPTPGTPCTAAMP
ncbi:intercellular adhesion molecule 1 [Perognathus longimembris pacificus]|uniref:intercellular adhesion molecule 1 n=1 Tax=Perognathus longimembris pacificus TaxID=214514 RepID=UPI00201866E6|nr:intercellular adhesion molecule 1 [Perognathus longimembris pacificus]